MSTVSPIIATLRASPTDDRMFQQALSNDYQRLQERSPNLEDHEINVFEAAFLILMKDHRFHPGALTIYVEEILGLSTKIAADFQKYQALRNAIHVRTLFLNLAVNNHPKQTSLSSINAPFQSFVSSAQEASIGQQIYNSIHHPGPHTSVKKDNLRRPWVHAVSGSTDATSTGSMDDPKLTELLAVYREAKSHFRGTEQNTEAYFTLARILCSKATDCIQYMTKVKSGDARLVELRDTLERVSGGAGVDIQGTKRRRE
ncbi:MAG: hypothetical protein Q9205_002270 [Flavoplaca limonia]